MDAGGIGGAADAFGDFVRPFLDRNPNVLALFGSADAPYSVLRLARRSQSFPSRVCTGGTYGSLPCNAADDCPGGSCDAAATCVGGSRAGQLCDGDADCPGSECGPSLFDFTGALVGGAVAIGG